MTLGRRVGPKRLNELQNTSSVNSCCALKPDWTVKPESSTYHCHEVTKLVGIKASLKCEDSLVPAALALLEDCSPTEDNNAAVQIRPQL